MCTIYKNVQLREPEVCRPQNRRLPPTTRAPPPDDGEITPHTNAKDGEVDAFYLMNINLDHETFTL